MIEPTVGRIVWYHPHVDQGGDVNGQPHGAFLAHVHSPRLINLTVFNENGSVYAKTSVKLLQDDDAPPPDGDYAEWMPFQKGQATKTEQLQAAPALSLDPIHAKLAELEAGTQGKFTELGDWLKKVLSDFEGRLAAVTAPPIAPANKPAAPAPAAAAEAQPAASAPGAAPQAQA